MPTPSATISTLQVGSYNSVTDVWTQTLDLNDRATYYIRPGGTTLSQPTKVYARSSNIRAPGERIAAAQYQNRHLTVALNLRATSTTGLIAACRALISAIERPPYALRIALPNSTQFSYADVVAVKHTIPSDPQQILSGAIVQCEIDFECRPGFRGDRLTLSNLVVNPGFEAPSGPGVGVFNDSLGTANAYTAAGGALSQDVLTFYEVALSFTPLRYYRLDDTSSTIIDASASAQNGTANGAVGFNQAGALNGSPDASEFFDGATAYISVPTTGMPSGNAAFTLMGWFKTSTTGTNQFIWNVGANVAKEAGQLYINSANQLVGGLNGSQIVSPSTYTNGAWHHAAFTWDGANAILYADGAQVASSTSFGANNLTLSGGASIGNQQSFGANFFHGWIDEALFYGGALSAAGVLAIYNAGHNAPPSAANTLLIPAGASATFGSSAWSAIQTWQVRFRFRTGMTAMFNAHGSGSNTLGAEIGGGTLFAQQTIAGTQHLLGSASFTTINEGWYWLQFTQFPAAPGTQCDVQATIYKDNNGAVGTQVAATGPVATFDGVTALSGQAQFSATGAALGLGGAFNGVHTLALFGPGGWTPNGGYNPGGGSPTGLTALAWEQTTSNTYPGGVVSSFGAARMDLPPTGTVDAAWETYGGGAPLGTSAIPTTTGNVMAASAMVKSSGLSVTAALALVLREWDVSGNLLRATTLQSVSGNHAAWTTLAGSVIIGVTTAYCSVLLQGSDAATGASAGGVVWWDNAQCWNQTTTGQSSMPYCELRFSQSPAQALVTGLQGDMVAPAQVSIGTYVASLALGYGIVATLGRRVQASANARMVAASIGFFGTALSPTATAALDTSSYGGYFITTAMNPAWNPRGFSIAPSDLLGVFHLVNRFWSGQSSGNLPNVQTRIVTQQKTGAWFGDLTSADQLGAYNGPWTTPIANSSVWSVVDSGQVNIPALPVGALTDLSQNYLTPRPQWEDLTLPLPSGSTARSNWLLLLPSDAETLIEQLINANNAPFAVASKWLWLYMDGLATQQGGASAATYSLESAPAPNAGHAGGGSGTSATGTLSVNSEASPFMTLDPQVSCPAVAGSAVGGVGVNQFAGYVSEAPYNVTAADALPLAMHVELSYSPLYLYPR